MYFVAAETDIGISRKINQDSLLVKHANSEFGEILLAAVCDGMGGLMKGELASAAVIRELSRWFDEELPYCLENWDIQFVSRQWLDLFRDLNRTLCEYGREKKMDMGTTATAMLFAGTQFLIGHVGDSRVYVLDSFIRQLTQDHTFVAREISRGAMTDEQAKLDSRRNMLLQCIGVTERVDPEIIVGETKKGVYMLCTDGFRNEVAEAELFEYLNPIRLSGKDLMQTNIRHLIEQVKMRGETDNISVIVVKVD